MAGQSNTQKEATAAYVKRKTLHSVTLSDTYERTDQFEQSSIAVREIGWGTPLWILQTHAVHSVV